RPAEVELRHLVLLVRRDDGDHERLAPGTADLRGQIADRVAPRHLAVQAQERGRLLLQAGLHRHQGRVVRLRRRHEEATAFKAGRRNAEFLRMTRRSGSRASGSSGRRISTICCGFTDRGTSRTIRYGSVCSPTLCPNRALTRDEISWARVSFTFEPRQALTMITSRAVSIVIRLSVPRGASPTEA